jgi:glycerophosphoryl diester phosphodiesterase
MSEKAPENTLPSFRMALDSGADGFEEDVQMTMDCVPVISHSYTIDAHSDGKGAIQEMTLDELRGYDFGSWKGDVFKGTRIPTLEESLSVIGGRGMVDMELKTPGVRRSEYLESVAASVESSGLGDRVLASSFDHILMSDFCDRGANCLTGAILTPTFDDIGEIMDIFAECYPADVPLDRLTEDDVVPLEDTSFIEELLGVEGADPKAVLLNMGLMLGSMFPGDVFGDMKGHVMEQADIPGYVAGLDFDPDYVICHYLSCIMDPDLVKAIHAMDKKILVWTVDDTGYAEKLIGMGVDGIVTDRPDLMVPLIR